MKNLQNVLVGSTDRVLRERSKIQGKPWMTQELLNLMDERRRWKLNTEKYNELDYVIIRKSIDRKEEWIMHKFNDIGDLDKAHSPRLYDKI